MSARHLSSLVPTGSPHQVGYTGLLLGPFSSNLFLRSRSVGLLSQHWERVRRVKAVQTPH